MRVWIGDPDTHLVCVEFVGLLRVSNEDMCIVRIRGMELKALPPDRIHLSRPVPEEIKS
jgi:hypothetical protein